jgi:hypothetical protein
MMFPHALQTLLFVAGGWSIFLSLMSSLRCDMRYDDVLLDVASSRCADSSRYLSRAATSPEAIMVEVMVGVVM